MLAIIQDKDVRNDLLKGLIGTGSVALSRVVSTANMESWLRITSLVVGIAVGMATFWAIVRKWKRSD